VEIFFQMQMGVVRPCGRCGLCKEYVQQIEIGVFDEGFEERS
jgi:hypothetical protein